VTQVTGLNPGPYSPEKTLVVNGTLSNVTNKTKTFQGAWGDRTPGILHPCFWGSLYVSVLCTMGCEVTNISPQRNETQVHQ